MTNITSLILNYYNQILIAMFFSVKKAIFLNKYIPFIIITYFSLKYLLIQMANLGDIWRENMTNWFLQGHKKSDTISFSSNRLY